MMFRDLDPITRYEFDRQIERDNMLYDIQQNTSDTAKQLDEANARIDILKDQIDAANDELHKTRTECDAVNRQFEEHRKDLTNRSNESTFMSVAAIVIALISLLVAYYK